MAAASERKPERAASADGEGHQRLLASILEQYVDAELVAAEFQQALYGLDRGFEELDEHQVARVVDSMASAIKPLLEEDARTQLDVALAEAFPAHLESRRRWRRLDGA